MKRIFAITALVVVLPLWAQEKKPAPAKPDRAAQARDALNKVKLDERAKERLKEAEAAFRKGIKNNDAAKAEIERLRNKDNVPDGKDAKTTIERLKQSVDENKIKELEAELKESTEAIRDEIRAYQEKRRREGKNSLTPSVPGTPAPPSEAPPVSFDNVSPPVPVAVLKAPDFPVSPIVMADNGIICGERDPRNPDMVLPENDPRRRMWVLSGNVKVRRPFMALDADEVDLFLKEGEKPDLSGNGKGVFSGSSGAADPVGGNKEDSGPFERIVARGRVRVMFVDRNGMVKIGRGGFMIYEAKTNVFIIKEWPEAEIGDKLLIGPSKDSVIKLSDLKSDDPNVELKGLKTETLERRLTPEELPKNMDSAVPPRGAIKPKAGAPESPASPAPR